MVSSLPGGSAFGTDSETANLRSEQYSPLVCRKLPETFYSEAVEAHGEKEVSPCTVNFQRSALRHLGTNRTEHQQNVGLPSCLTSAKSNKCSPFSVNAEKSPPHCFETTKQQVFCDEIKGDLDGWGSSQCGVSPTVGKAISTSTKKERNNRSVKKRRTVTVGRNLRVGPSQSVSLVTRKPSKRQEATKKAVRLFRRSSLEKVKRPKSRRWKKDLRRTSRPKPAKLTQHILLTLPPPPVWDSQADGSITDRDSCSSRCRTLRSLKKTSQKEVVYVVGGGVVERKLVTLVGQIHRVASTETLQTGRSSQISSFSDDNWCMSSFSSSA